MSSKRYVLILSVQAVETPEGTLHTETFLETYLPYRDDGRHWPALLRALIDAGRAELAAIPPVREGGQA